MDRTTRTTRPRAASIRSLGAAGLLVAVLAGCGLGSRPSFHLPSGAIAIPTDPGLVSAADSGILCNASATIPHVEGYLRGDPNDSAWPVWLEAADGHRQYVLWPPGFSVRFTPEPELLDERGTLVLTSVLPFELGQVGADPNLGTKDHPYVAGGLWGTRCYHHST
jgi:hypothetical protein